MRCFSAINVECLKDLILCIYPRVIPRGSVLYPFDLEGSSGVFRVMKFSIHVPNNLRVRDRNFSILTVALYTAFTFLAWLESR